MKINNWDKWQTYRKDRGTPPWIKVHRNLLSNPEWVELSDAEKGQLISLWILAADKSGVIPDSPKVLMRMAMLDEVPNISKFKELGFLVTDCQPSGNHLVTTCPQLDAPETEAEAEVEADRKEADKKVSVERARDPIKNLDDLEVGDIDTKIRTLEVQGGRISIEVDFYLLEDFKTIYKAQGEKTANGHKISNWVEKFWKFVLDEDKKIVAKKEPRIGWAI